MLTFTVVAKAHSGLAQANGVFPSTNTIKLLEFGLFDTLCIHWSDCVPFSGIGTAPGRGSAEAYLARKVEFNGLYADVLWSRRHSWVCSGRLKFQEDRSVSEDKIRVANEVACSSRWDPPNRMASRESGRVCLLDYAEKEQVNQWKRAHKKEVVSECCRCLIVFLVQFPIGLNLGQLLAPARARPRQGPILTVASNRRDEGRG